MANGNGGSRAWAPAVRWGVLGLGLLILLVAGWLVLSWAFTRGPAAPAPLRLTVAVPSTPHAALLHIAAFEGFFAQEGLDVKLKPVSHGKAGLDLVVRDEADLASAAEVPFVIAVLKGQRLGLAASVVNASDEMAVVARRDRGITHAEDLVGKRVGVTLGTSGEYFLWAFLTRHRLSPDAVQWVDVPPTGMVRALDEGVVDAIATWEPVKAGALAALGDNGLAFTEGAAYTVTHVIVGNSDRLQGQSDAMARLARGLLRAEALARTDPARAQAVVAAALGMRPDALAPVWAGLTIRVDLRQSQLVTLEDEARWAMARGHAPVGPLPDFMSRLHVDTLLGVAPDRVTIVR